MPSLTCNQERKRERMGTVLFRLTLLACGVLAATAGPAFANATIEFVGPTANNGSMVRVIGNGDNDVIKLTQNGASLTFAPTGVTLTPTAPCTGGGAPGAPVVCPAPDSVSADFGAGDDKFTTENVAVPLALA